MNDTALNLASDCDANSSKYIAQVSLNEGISRRAIDVHIVAMVEKLKSLLEDRFSNDSPEIIAALEFLHAYLSQADLSSNQFNQDGVDLRLEESSISRLQSSFDFSDVEIQILILAGMAQDHEAFADIFRSLHPNRQSYPTAALLIQLLCADEQQRQMISLKLTSSRLFTDGIIALIGDTPILTRSLVIDANDWHAISSGKAQLNHEYKSQLKLCHAGMTDWLNSEQVSRACICIDDNQSAVIMLKSVDMICTINRARLIAQSQNKQVLCVSVNHTTDNQTFNKIALHAVLSNKIPVLIIEKDEHNSVIKVENLNCFAGCVLVCCRSNQVIDPVEKFSIELAIDKLPVKNLIEMWQYLIPELHDSSHHLAARLPLDPAIASQKVQLFRNLTRHDNGDMSLEHVVAFFKQNSNGFIPEGIKRITPSIAWSELILPKMQKDQLREAMDRLVLQHKVLDEWQFLQNRRGAKGVRLLFSGSPGTGKTLAAEVLANSLEVDLLIVDLASVVSKWIGETEKNLAKIFSYAEQSQAVLLFDEADAIFGKRTEVSDSHDRYANLETAYLLTRLEAYEGMAILATNYKNNIDAAFVRRLDYIIDFREPSGADRERLWRSHVPVSAPIHSSVDFAKLANLYPMVGGEIRNAAVAAAYFAAQKQLDIHQDHFVSAIRREYEKTGKAFREVNAF